MGQFFGFEKTFLKDQKILKEKSIKVP